MTLLAHGLNHAFFQRETGMVRCNRDGHESSAILRHKGRSTPCWNRAERN